MNQNKNLVIVDYDVGNVRSVENAVMALGDFNVSISSQPEDLEAADCLILPGVGAYGDSMAALHKSGLISVLNKQVLEKRKPLMAICVGMQLLFEHSQEGNVEGLGWLKGGVVKFDISEELSVPHLGWNNVNILKDQWLFEGMGAEKNFYFAHSYHAQTQGDYIVATCDYGETFPAIVRKDNILGAQFHPEKSHNVGLKLIRNFINAANNGDLYA